MRIRGLECWSDKEFGIWIADFGLKKMEVKRFAKGSGVMGIGVECWNIGVMGLNGVMG